MRIEAAVTIDRPVDVVWEFYAINHIANHPRWDETIELEAISEGPIGLGTVIKRRVTRFGTVTEGTMEVTEFDPGAAMRVNTEDGGMSIDGFALFDAVSDRRTRLTIGAEIPGVDESTGDQIRMMIGRSAATIKTLIESEQ
ncbi:MAG: hypothetical protein R3246_11610 [Acidimicrobiia bacterium]|nr:hypothetical protein [Acidimicrobiia bacterium]